MTDDQFVEIIKVLKTPPPAQESETWWEKIINSTLTSLVTALVLGFCFMVWTWGMSFKDQTEKSQKEMEAMNTRVDAMQETFKSEIATVKATVQVVKTVTNVVTSAVTVAPAPVVNAANLAEEINKSEQNTQWKIDEIIKSKKGSRP